MQDTIGRRKDDVKINKRIDAVIIDLDDCRKNVHEALNEISTKVASISKDLASHKDDVSRLSNELSLVAGNLKSIFSILEKWNDMFVAWNNVQGGLKVVKFFSSVAKVLTPIVLLVSFVTAGVAYLYHKLS